MALKRPWWIFLGTIPPLRVRVANKGLVRDSLLTMKWWLLLLRGIPEVFRNIGYLNPPAIYAPKLIQTFLRLKFDTLPRYMAIWYGKKQLFPKLIFKMALRCPKMMWFMMWPICDPRWVQQQVTKWTSASRPSWAVLPQKMPWRQNGGKRGWVPGRMTWNLPFHSVEMVEKLHLFYLHSNARLDPWKWS